MRVGKLELQDFRNYREQSVDLAEGLNLVVGKNAQGKTNLLEAVYCLSGFGSPRSPDAALVRQGAERALIHSDFTRATRTVTIDIELRPGRGARCLVNKTALPSARALAEVAVSVFFGPDELSLVKGSPDGRRRFLDELVVKLRPAQQELRREMDRVAKQRNALLKSLPKRGPLDHSSLQTLEVWDEQFTRAAVALAQARLLALAQLLPFARRRYEAIAGGGGIELSYSSSWLPEDASRSAVESAEPLDMERAAGWLRDRIETLRQREIERGQALAGPQRDDVVVRLRAPSVGGGFLDARTYASQGDQRTAALALKLGEHDLLTDALGDTPVLLLDDVFSELDPARRGWLREAVRDAGQTVVSSADTDAWRGVGAERTFHVEAGEATTDG